VQEIFEEFGLSAEESALVTEFLAQNPDKWADFLPKPLAKLVLFIVDIR